MSNCKNSYWVMKKLKGIKMKNLLIKIKEIERK